MAAACDALAPFTVGLGKQAAGAVLVQRLGYSTAAAPAVWQRSAPAPAGAVVIGDLLTIASWRRRLLDAARLTVPHVDYMRGWARRHPVGEPAHPATLPMAYFLRVWCVFFEYSQTQQRVGKAPAGGRQTAAG